MIFEFSVNTILKTIESITRHKQQKMLSVFLLAPLLSYIWTFPLLILWFANLKLWVIKNSSTINRVKNSIILSSLTDESNKPGGYFFGKWFIGYEHEKSGNHGPETVLYILCSSILFKSLIKCDNVMITYSDSPVIISIFERSGNFFYFRYLERNLDVTRFKARSNQQKIINNITNMYSNTSRLVAFIHGPPGTGKTIVSMLIAKELNAAFCKTWNPTDPGDELSILYSQVSPTKNKPIILVLEEVDILLRRIHVDDILPHKGVPIQVRNKISWNSLLDDINIGLYPYLILILTSNKSPDFIRELDPSYIREGRVDIISSLTSQ